MTDPQQAGGPPPASAAAGPAGPTSGVPPQVVPGWYPDPTNGQLRWWDGAQWGPFADAATPGVPAAAAPGSPGYGVAGGPGYQTAPGGGTNPTTMAMLAHLLGLFAGFVGPLIIFVTAGKQDPYVRDQAGEALNFQLTMLIGTLVSIVLMFVLIGFVTIFVVMIANWIFCIMAAMAANRGEWYRYPVNIRMVH